MDQIVWLKGEKRLKNKAWMKAIEDNIDAWPYSVCFYAKMIKYIEWVKKGGGDEWFVDDR